MDAKPVPALVGRARELAEVEAALDRLAEREPWLVQVVGEPGIGKSRLLAELCRRGEDRGYLVLDGRAAEFEQDVPFGLIVDALNDYLGSLQPAVLRALDDELLTELGSVFPSLARHGASGSARGDGIGRYRLHYAVRGVLERLAARQPMVLALDDVHWADAASVEVLTHLLRRFRGPLLTAVAYRPMPTRLLGALEAAARGGAGIRMEPAPLTAAEVRRLLRPEVDDATSRRLHHETGGNPFYIEQLVRAGRGRPPGRAGRFSGPAVPEDVRAAVPRAVTAAIDQELQAVSETALVTLRSAAVAGESFEPELVSAIAEEDLAATLTVLDELLAVDLIRPTEAPRRFRFRHPIVRHAVYDGAPPGWRIGAHARAATALAALRAPARVRAHHVEHSAIAGDEAAIALLVDAGREAAPRAPETAGRWLLAATRLLAPDDAESRRLSLLAEAATALVYAGAYEEALAALDDAAGRVPADRADERARLAARIAFAKRMSGHPLESRDLVQRVLASLTAEAPGTLTLTLEVALDHYWRGEFAAMYEVARDVLERARVRGARLAAAWSAALCSLASTSLHRQPDGIAELEEAEAICAALTDEELTEQIDVAGYVAQAAATLERPDDALDHTRRALRLAELTGQTPFVPGLLVLETNALFMKGRIAEALAVAENATEAAILTGNEQFAVWALWADAVVASAAGETDRALAGAREAVARCDRVAETFFSSLSRLHLAAALSSAGDAAGARVELAAFEAGPDQRLLDLRGAHGWELLVDTQLSLGDLAAAASSAETAEARARASALPQRIATAACTQAAVRLARDDAAGALEAAREALTRARPAGNPVLSARAQVLIGAALGRLGEHRAGIADLEQAERTLFACGARREADRAAQELRRLGRRSPRRPRSATSRGGTHVLSAREREVAALVAAGKRNRDVAAALFVSEKTVESHLARIYDKLGVRSRAALAAIVAAEAEPALVIPQTD
jgi:ATP/maltotriose-dependent transcriptional regulator MalT